MKKLTLSKETLAHLSQHEVSQLAGGATYWPPCGSYINACGPTYQTCPAQTCNTCAVQTCKATACGTCQQHVCGL